jgi:polyvinyl alcohol dehydrogenase (cytochrome)
MSSEGDLRANMKRPGAAVVVMGCAIGWMTSWNSPATSQPVPDDRTGSEIYEQRCSVCHDHAHESAPPKDFLASRTQAYIVNALTNGLMQGIAKGLSPSEITAVAHYLTSSSASGGQSKLPEPDLRANLCTKAPPPITLEGAWNGFGPNLDNARFQPQPGFRVEDIPHFKPKWVLAYPGGTTGGAPSVVAGRVFVGTAAGVVMSLDAATGCTYWVTQPAEPVKVPVTVAIWPQSKRRNRLQTEAAAYFGDRKAVVHAVDAMSGKEIWATEVDENKFATISGALTLDRGAVYVPVTSGEGAMGPRGDYPCCTFRGSMVALDAYTGKMLWKTYTIAETPKPFQLNAAGTQMYGPAGVGIWSPATVDPKRKVVYGATAESKTARSVDTSDAMMAFNLKTGTPVWATQATSNDNWIQGCEGSKPGANCPDPLGPDADFSTPAILFTFPNGKRLLIAGQKSGWVTAFDPDAHGKIAWRRNLAAEAKTPPGVILRDRAQPGIVFGLASDHTSVYAAIADPDKTTGHIPLGVYALNPADGSIVWHTPGEPVPSCAWGAEGCAGAQRTAVTAIPGAIFAGSSNGHIRAYSNDNGAVLWDFDTARNYQAVNGVEARGGSIEGIATAAAEGLLFVTSGLATYGGGRGNALIAFSVEGK